jgi:hypothetical protein
MMFVTPMWRALVPKPQHNSGGRQHHRDPNGGVGMARRRAARVCATVTTPSLDESAPRDQQDGSSRDKHPKRNGDPRSRVAAVSKPQDEWKHGRCADKVVYSHRMPEPGGGQSGRRLDGRTSAAAIPASARTPRATHTVDDLGALTSEIRVCGLARMSVLAESDTAPGRRVSFQANRSRSMI